jgi:hypothetical protein
VVVVVSRPTGRLAGPHWCRGYRRYPTCRPVYRSWRRRSTLTLTITLTLSLTLSLTLTLTLALALALTLALSLSLSLSLSLALALTLQLRECFGPLRLVFAHYVKHAAIVPAATSPQEGRANAALMRTGRGGGDSGRGRGGGGGGGGGGGAAAAVAAHTMTWPQLQGFAQSVTLLRKSFDLENLARLSEMLVGADPKARLLPV